MLFPLLIGVAAGVALERYYLAEKDAECKAKEKKKDEPKAKEEEKKNEQTSSIMDFINKAKQRHPAVVPRRIAAKKLMMKLEGSDKEEQISKETFEKTKAVVEEYCGIRKLEYDEEEKTVCGGEIDEECPETPILDSAKLDCLTKAEVILIAPKLKDLFMDEA